MLTWFRWITLMIALSAASICGYRAIPWSCVDATVTAYWVQAIGSIAAIFGAFAIGNSQNRHNRQIAGDLAKEAVRRKWSSIKAVIDDLHQQIIDTEAAFHEIDVEFGNLEFLFRYKERYFALSLSRVNAIPIFELESDQLVSCIVSYQRFANAMPGWISAAEDFSLGRDTELECDTRELKIAVLEIIENAKTAYGKIVDITGGDRVIEPRNTLFINLN